MGGLGSVYCSTESNTLRIGQVLSLPPGFISICAIHIPPALDGQHGAESNARTGNQRQIPLEMATVKGDQRMIRFLLGNGAVQEHSAAVVQSAEQRIIVFLTRL